MKNLFEIIMLLLLIVALIAFGPMLLLWGLDFMGFPIEFTLSSWFGAFLVQAFIGTAVGASNKAK